MLWYRFPALGFYGHVSICFCRFSAAYTNDLIDFSYVQGDIVFNIGLSIMKATESTNVRSVLTSDKVGMRCPLITRDKERVVMLLRIERGVAHNGMVVAMIRTLLRTNLCLLHAIIT